MNQIAKKWPLANGLCFLIILTLLTPMQPVVASASDAPDRIVTLLRQVDEAQASHNKPKLADALYDIARQYTLVDDNVNAEKYLRQCLEVERTMTRAHVSEQDSTPPLVLVLNALSNLCIHLNKFDEAISYSQEAIAASEKFGSSKNAIVLLEGNIGTTLRAAGKVREAEDALKKALAMAGTSCPMERATVLQNLQSLYDDQARRKEALALAKDVYTLYKDHGSDDQAFDAQLAIAKCENRAGNPDAALRAYSALADRIKADGTEALFAPVLSKAETGEGDIYSERQQMSKALSHYKAAVKAAEDSPVPLIEALNAEGRAEAYLDLFDDAQSCHSRAFNLARTQHLTKLEIDSILRLAQDYQLQGKAEEALKQLTEATALADRPPADQHAKAEIALLAGRCHRDLGQRGQAIVSIKDAIAGYRNAGLKAEEAIATISLGSAYLDHGQLEKFSELDKESQPLYDAIKEDVHSRISFDFNRAQAQILRGEYGPAITSLNAILASDTAGNTGLQAPVYRALGLCYLYQGSTQNSLDSYLKAQELTKDSGSLDTQWSGNLGIGKAYVALKKYPEAEPYLRKAMDCADKERSQLTRDVYKTNTLDFRSDCYNEAVTLYALMNNPEKALESAERGTARAFLDMLANRTDRRVETLATLAAPAVVAPVPAKVSTGAPAETGTRSVMPAYKEVVEPEQVVSETAISPIYQDAPQITEMKQLVKKHGSAVLEYFVTKDKIYVWVVDASGEKITMAPPIASTPALKNQVSRLYGLITKAPKTPQEIVTLGLARQKELRQLYDTLVAPAESLLPKDSEAIVTIIPNSYLFGIPFAALMNKDGKYLIEQHTLSYAPAIGVLRGTEKLDEEIGNAPHTLLAFGNPITKDNAFLGALPYAEKEVQHIANLYGKDRSSLEIGAAATKDRFCQLLPSATDIHLATHGLVDEGNPMESFVVLAPTPKDTGRLRVKDIIELKNLKTHLVVLSACQTGRGQIRNDGVIGLARAFIIAGTPSIIVSQWNVDDIMTEYQMGKFYAAYLKGQDKAHALRGAQLSTIEFMESGNLEPGKPRANPRFWAAFELIGENN